MYIYEAFSLLFSIFLESKALKTAVCIEISDYIVFLTQRVKKNIPTCILIRYRIKLCDKDVLHGYIIVNDKNFSDNLSFYYIITLSIILDF